MAATTIKAGAKAGEAKAGLSKAGQVTIGTGESATTTYLKDASHTVPTYTKANQ